MKKIYLLDSWVIFLIIIIPIIIQNTDIGGILSLITFLLGAIWFFQLTNDLFKKLPGGHFMSLNKFKFHFFFPIVYFTVVLFTMGGYTINSNNIDEYGGLGPVLMILHLFSIYCIFYCFYFTSKTLICVFGKEKNVELTAYIGYIFGFFFMPIGIWFIQPKVKTIFAD